MVLLVLIKMIILLLALSSLSWPSNHYKVEGGRILSEEEDLELERQLKFLNKPPIKTIQTEIGDTFDCIDIHKQPALDHPLLKNHKIQMRPTTQPKKVLSNSTGTTSSSSETQHSITSSVFKRLDCPEGTVPIRRTTKEDLIRAKSFFESYSSSINEVTKTIPGQHVAIRRSKYTQYTNAYYGVHGYINLANPKVRHDQYSAAQVWIEGGPPYQLNTLQAGWLVSPKLFGDSLTRFFVYSNTDKQHKQGCYNLLCQGFVQVHHQIAVGSELYPVSTYKGIQHIMFMTIYQDVNGTGDWWLKDPNESAPLGYWPKNLFTNLQNGAQSVAWGGLVQGTPNGPSPQMGNGLFPHHYYTEACSVVHLQVVTHNGDLIDQNDSDFENVVDNSDCYNLEYNGFMKERQRYSFLFGGPGGDNCGT